MLKTIKPKNARTKRILKKREPKVEENVKTAIFVRGSTTSQVVNDALSDLCRLRRTNSINFTKKNNVHPFDDDTSLNFYCSKNDASLFVIGSHSKKRPHNLVFGRMFDGQLLDMIEVGIEKAITMNEIKSQKCSVGMKPLFIFNGDLFETSQVHKTFKNMMLDFFRGQNLESINISGLEYVISITATGSIVDSDSTAPSTSDGKIFFRVYTIQMTKSGQKAPRVELEEMGPSYDFKLRRTKFANEEVYKIATKVPKTLKPKKVKNIDVNEIGDKVGHIHVGRQDLGKLQTRKMKGLKRMTEDDQTEDWSQRIEGVFLDIQHVEE
ncbi:ribosome production factor 2 [Gigaspora rosea]|uniref:Ribosome production factor 2 homolog n=1 Tax=Gigaspora rosea TaxID=44941 RepID=A0A397UE40_9GLOM|nr:ribosome production factor 2 [Gigaspora rosea]